MTPEEMQNIIEGMLSVQRELQNSQLKQGESISKLKESIIELRESVADLKEVSQRHERRLEQLIGYSISGESDRLDLLQRLQTLERKVSKLEQPE